MERENNFYVRVDLQVKVKDGKEVLGAINNFLNNPEIGVRKATLLGMTVINDEMSPLQDHLSRIPRTVPILDATLEKSSSFVKKDAVFEHLIEAVKSGSGYISGLDTSTKLVRSLPGLTKENLFYWEKKGYVHPGVVQRGLKKGRIFSTPDAFKVAYIWQFRQEGFDLPTAVKKAEQELLKIKESQTTLSSTPGSIDP